MKNILVLCGGQSVEHEVSLRSARYVLSVLDRELFQPIVLVISRDGCWNLLSEEKLLDEISFLNQTDSRFKIVTLQRKTMGVFLISAGGDGDVEEKVDIAFPVLHGTKGEDGTWQGVLELLDIPFVGSGVLGSAICMNKAVAKILLTHAGLNTAPSITLSVTDEMADYAQLSAQWQVGSIFVKPIDSGSSVGIRKVKTQQELEDAMHHALQFSPQVIVEGEIKGREIECAVLAGLQNKAAIASCLAEIKPAAKHEFYTYEAKYLDPHGAEFIVPAALPKEVEITIQKMALKAFAALYCLGMARVDFFVTEDLRVFVNEINTIPGFTAISMYPQLMALSGIKGKELMNRLLALAEEEFQRKASLSMHPDAVI